MYFVDDVLLPPQGQSSRAISRTRQPANIRGTVSTAGGAVGVVVMDQDEAEETTMQFTGFEDVNGAVTGGGDRPAPSAQQVPELPFGIGTSQAPPARQGSETDTGMPLPWMLH